MKFSPLPFILLLGLGITASAQVTVSLGTYTGAGSTNVLLSTSTTINRYSRTISLYTASEIITAGGSAGTITSLAWDKYGTGEYITNDAYIKIYLKHITVNKWLSVPDWSTQVSGATEVFTSSTYSIPTGTGWKTVPFTNNFTWNGVDNIAVFVEWDRSSTPTGDISWGRSTDTSTNATRVGSTSLAALVLIINSNRPLLQLTFSSSVPVTSLSVSTQGSVPAVISTLAGTLQMTASVLPVNANQAVTWSIVPGTGMASISTTGLVTAQSDGSVWAKAVSVQDPTKMDSLQITISNQIVPITSISVTTLGSVPAVIATNAGTLQMSAAILPVSANQAVTWSLTPGTGMASISSTGLVTAQSNGTVWAKAVSVQDPTKMDSLQITISNQIIPITNISVTTLGSVPAVITTLAGTLQMVSAILPVTANQNVTWSIIPGTGTATISSAGLVSAQTNGTVWAKAVSVQDPSKKDSLQITISNQDIGFETKITDSGFRVYPNPVISGVINIEVLDENFSRDADVSILDALGRVIKIERMNSSKLAVSLYGLPSGIYVIQLRDGLRQESRKFLVE